MVIRVYYLEVFARNLGLNFKINVAGELAYRLPQSWRAVCLSANEMGRMKG